MSSANTGGGGDGKMVCDSELSLKLNDDNEHDLVGID
jgi:hypothetical protein